MSSSKPHILLVEDHADTCELLALVLSLENYELTTSPGVNKALELTRNLKFDIMIFDSRLEDGDGIDLCRTIRQQDQLTPILFYSGLAFQQEKETAMAAGAQAYLVKPVDIPVLMQTLKELLGDVVNTERVSTRATGSRKSSGDLPSVALP